MQYPGRIVGVYHSHPASPARLSQEDVRLANDPQLYYVIISLLNPVEPVLKAFRVMAREVTEAPIQIMKGSDNDNTTI